MEAQMGNWTIAIIATVSAFISALMALLAYLQSRELVMGNVGILESQTNIIKNEDQNVVDVIFSFCFQNIGKKKVIIEKLKVAHIVPNECKFETMPTSPPLNQIFPDAKAGYSTSFRVPIQPDLQEQEIRDLAANSLWEHILILIYEYSCKDLYRRKKITGKYYYEIGNNCNLFYLIEDKYKAIENMLPPEFKRD